MVNFWRGFCLTDSRYLCYTKWIYQLHIPSFCLTGSTVFLLYAFFWVISRRLNCICRRFGTLCLFHLHRQLGVNND